MSTADESHFRHLLLLNEDKNGFTDPFSLSEHHHIELPQSEAAARGMSVSYAYGFASGLNGSCSLYLGGVYFIFLSIFLISFRQIQKLNDLKSEKLRIS
jgi:hypothetical protein